MTWDSWLDRRKRAVLAREAEVFAEGAEKDKLRAAREAAESKAARERQERDIRLRKEAYERAQAERRRVQAERHRMREERRAQAAEIDRLDRDQRMRVSAWQASRGLPITGVVDALTRLAMEAALEGAEAQAAAVEEAAVDGLLDDLDIPH